MRSELLITALCGLCLLTGCLRLAPPAPPPSVHLPAVFEPDAVATALGRHLDEEVLRFWTDPRVVDSRYGGFLNGFDADGLPMAPDAGRPLIPYLRLLFVHAVAIQRTQDDQERIRIRRQYDLAFDYLVAHYLDPQNGGWFFEIDRQGKVSDASKQSVAQAYVVYTMSEIHRRISDSRARRLAIDSFAWFDARAHDPEHGGYVEYADLPATDARNAKKALGTNMHAALALARLFQIAPAGLYRERLGELFDRLTQSALVPASANGLMQMTRDWQPATADGPPHQQTLYGHNAELMWYLQDVAATLGKDPATVLPWLRRVADGFVRNGLMPDGGVYVWGPLAGKGTDQDDIRWWPQTEAMIMLLRMYALTREPQYWQAFERVTRFTFGHLVVDRSGAWLGGINRKTGERMPRGGWAWKAGLHVSRALLECEQILHELPQAPVVYHPPRGQPRRAVQIDTGFAYYRNRSAASIAAEVRANGFDAIHLICLTDRVEPPDLVTEARRQGLEVWGTFFPTGVYMPAELFGPEAATWRMQFSTDLFATYRFFSYVHPGYQRWWREHLLKMCQKYPFDGILFYEVHYPTRAGPLAQGQPLCFSDISPAFVSAFQRATGHSTFPTFTDAADPDYFTAKPRLYADFCEFRVQSIVDFQRQVLDGDGGVRRQFPDVQFATWTLALAGPGNVAALRETESQDAPRFAAELRPDVHIFQSHYPDWLPANQKPDYIRGYAPYIEAVREAFPDLPLGVQADVASTQPFRRDPAWLRTAAETARALGLVVTTYYEFSLRWEVYFAPPVVHSATLDDQGTALITFDQRLDPTSCAALEGRDLGGGGRIQEAGIDGNLLRFRVTGPLQTGAVITIPLGGMATDPAVRLALPDKGPGGANRVPPEQTVVVTVAAPVR
jgi:mannose/cellobiose epimerase-like protein (N-acyl-D-glucosamine 2-epimerase family)